MKNFAQSLVALWGQLGINQRVSLTIVTLAVVGGMIGVGLWSRRPDYQLLYARLGEKDAASIIGYLESQNVPHRVTAGGTAVQVPSEQVYKLRMDLAGKGLPNGEGVGFEIFDKGQFGLSDFVQRTNYLRAVQGELARTISQLQGVKASRVMIVQPENRLLLTDQGVKSTASVFVDMGSGRLETEQVNAIRHLVANAVQGLQPDEVAVVDNRGHVLSEDLKQDPTLGTASSQMRYRQQVEEYLAKKVESMLAPVVGAGNAVVRVSADIDTEATTLTEEKFDPEGQVVRSQTSSDDISNTVEARSAGGPVGVSANVPDKAGATAAATAPKPSASTDTSRKNRTTTYEINRTLTNITRSPGSVKNVTAAVLVASRPAAAGATGPAAKRTPEELNILRQMVINSLGLKAAPGQSLDTMVTVDEMAFSVEPVTPEMQSMEKQGRWMGWLEASSRWFAFLAAVAVFFVFIKLLGRQRPEAVPVEILTMAPDALARTRSPAHGVTPDLLNDLIRQRPANVGATLREWITPRGN
jgi:flagellar M-ring protein FliF